jgi:nicotinate-nucleotide pyrophosphorylase (carboxylating)
VTDHPASSGGASEAGFGLLGAVRLDLEQVGRVVRAALDEDIGARDATTEATIPVAARARGVLLAKQDLILAGLAVAATVLRERVHGLAFEAGPADGTAVKRGEVIARVSGSARGLLTAERVALNFLQRMSGVATLTRRFVDAVEGTRARIRDTRKTTPLLRFLEKYAVFVAGGVPHRAGLDGAILVKDNHVRIAGSVGEATRRARAGAGGLQVEVEVEAVDQVEEAIREGAQIVLLDNFDPGRVREAVAVVAGRVPVEVSGGVTLANVRGFAEAGADFIAVGALTHSAPGVDISLELESAS